MKVIGIKYYGAFYDNSGYGEAARYNVKAINELGIPIKITNVSFAPQPSLFKEDVQFFEELSSKDIEYNLCIYHFTPENVPRFLEKGKINIIHTTWETNKLHPHWVPICNSVNAILVPSSWNIEVFRNSGVTVPILKFPHIFNVNKFDGVEPLNAFERFNNTLKFYSVFQWSERKNPYGLIRTYLSEFNEKDDVVLFLKTYVANGTKKDALWVIDEINNIKSSIVKDVGQNFPKMVALTDIMDEKMLNSLHKSMDVYLAPVRGEGFGMPILDAVLAERNIIATGYSAQMDFLNRDIHSLLNYQLTTVCDMNWVPWYLSDQYWAEADLSQFAEKLRFYYMYWKNNEKQLPFEKERKEWAKYISNEYSKETVIERLLEQLNEI